MKITRQFLLLLSILFFLFSCKDDEKPANTNPATKKDSLPKRNAEPVINNYDDKSPMDMSYFPVDYPTSKMTNFNLPPPVLRVVYSRPHLQGRQLFHDILKYNERWRLGANESTEIDFYKETTIQDKKVKPGRYILYCIPQPDKWTIVLNTNIDSWGLVQDTTKDVQRFDIPITHINPRLEFFTMSFEKTTDGADLIMAWDDLLARLPINFKQ